MLIRKCVCIILLGNFCVCAGTQTEKQSAENQTEQLAAYPSQPAYAPQPDYSTQTPYNPQYSSTPTTSVTGFCAGIDIGVSSFKNKLSKGSKKKSKKKRGLSGDIFAGYNIQFGKFIAGVEGLIGMDSPKPKTEMEVSKSDTATSSTTTQIESVSLKSKYKFGLVPHIGYNVFNGFNLYVGFGPVVNKYKLKHQTKQKDSTQEENRKKGKTKTSMALSLKAEQNFGSWFIRIGYNKVFTKNVGEINSTKVKSDSSVVNTGLGLHF